MQYRVLGRTGWNVSCIGFGGWAIGGTWGPVNDSDSLKALIRAAERGVTFFDTADVYGDGHSERLMRKLREEYGGGLIIATKVGRRLTPHTAEGYNRKNLTAFIERSLLNIGTDALDLVQLHCPPGEVYSMPEVFGILDDLTQEGKIHYYGVSVEKVEEALRAIEYPDVQSVQLIFNMFRPRPAEDFFQAARIRGTGIIARLPLASGMLAGKLKPDSVFSSDDHRQYNREGERFDRGETFSGVEYETGLEAVEALKALCPAGMAMAQFALRWILMYEEVSCAIPGAKTPQQVDENTDAAGFAALDPHVMGQVRAIYNRHLRNKVHHLW